ncbi:MAG: hypothetical protein M5U26_08445 [Planctomycetota bacterium]|nr:hypothetical protein [Planctomycetota bacterium]
MAKRELPDPEDLARLLAWLNAWQAAQAEFFAWVEAEYARRLKAFEGDRKRARGLLALEAERMPFGRDGRLDRRPGRHDRAKRKLRAKTDQVLEGLVLRGLDRFGARGRWNRMGVFIGNLDRITQRLALAKLKLALSQAARETRKSLKQLAAATE